MQPTRLPVTIRAAALVASVLPVACSRSASDHPAGTGGNGLGDSGAAAAGGASGGIDDGDGTAGPSGDDLLFVPQGLPNTNVDGEDVGLTLMAFTLVQGATGPDLYAAVRNDGDTPACQPGMTTYFYDKAGQQVTSTGSVLQTDRFYRLADGTVIACIDPGEISMAASTGLPGSIVIDELGSLQHLFPSFTVQGIVPVAGLAVGDVQVVATDAGRAYTGKLTNGLDVTASAPSVMIFPVNRVGRPLGVATSSTTTDLVAGGSWTFETSSVEELGVDERAFPAASIVQ